MMPVNDTSYPENSSCTGLFVPPSEPDITKWIALLEVIGIVSLNLSVIVLLARLDKRSRMTFFVQHLAVADLCIGLLYVMPECVFDRFLMNWEKYSCLVLYGYCANLTNFASTFLIVVLTFDRMFAITKPLSVWTRGPKYRGGFVFGAWCFALLFAIPYACYAEFSCGEGNHSICSHSFGEGIYAMVIFEIVIHVVLPVCIITFCYVRMISVMWRRETSISTSIRINSCMSKRVKLDTTLPMRPTISRAKRKTVKLLLVIVIVYIVSWTPLNVAQVMNTFDYLHVGQTFVYLHVLAPTNSLMNPLVFLMFNRQMFKKQKRIKNVYTI